MNEETISSIIEKTKKGCWKEFVEGGYEPEEEEDYITCMEEQLCPTCQSRLQALNECANMIEKMIEEIWTINGTGCFYLKGINNNEVRRVERLKKFASQLKQEEEKQDENS